MNEILSFGEIRFLDVMVVSPDEWAQNVLNSTEMVIMALDGPKGVFGRRTAKIETF